MWCFEVIYKPGFQKCKTRQNKQNSVNTLYKQRQNEKLTVVLLYLKSISKFA